MCSWRLDLFVSKGLYSITHSGAANWWTTWKERNSRRAYQINERCYLGNCQSCCCWQLRKASWHCSSCKCWKEGMHGDVDYLQGKNENGLIRLTLHPGMNHIASGWFIWDGGHHYFNSCHTGSIQGRRKHLKLGGGARQSSYEFILFISP